MEEEGVVKAPVTRLRRRLSVEAEDVKSPSTPSTPNKKRGGRLAAKPQLELINENATENMPKRTKKSIAKDIIEPAEEKPATPSRRSARIRSNTSIVSEITQVTDSPRAKRVARRNSQIGSDNEAPSTPVRATRRTRKDSTSSIDKQADTVGINKVEPIKEVIPEEVENISKDDSSDSKNVNTSTRKSPRLTKNNDKRRSSSKQEFETDENKKEQIKEQQTSVMENESESINVKPTIDKYATSVRVKDRSKKDINTPERNDLSVTSTNLLNDLETNSKKTISGLNKSTSAVETSNNEKTKRHRTKSFTTISIASPNESHRNFHSDNESTKKINKSSGKISNQVNRSKSGDSAFNLSNANDKSEEIMKNFTKQPQVAIEKSLLIDTIATSSITPASEKSKNRSKSLTATPKCINVSNESNKENLSASEDDTSNSGTIFEKAPSDQLQPLVYIEDTDSNTGSVEKAGSINNFDVDDQCVPVVQHLVDKTNVQDESCEPMDIDITIPGNISGDISEDMKSASFKETSNSSRRKSSLCIAAEKPDVTNKSVNKSERKSSISQMESQNLEKSSNENKSTLILSQIKDISTNNVSTSRSPKVTNNESLNLNTLPIDTKSKVSDTYLTSTPLQQKPFKKLIQMNTSIISPQEVMDNTKELKNTSIGDKYKASKSEASSEEESDVEEESRERNEIFDDEAEEASDDYESGDSRNKEEREYEDENEIRERGETLDSEEDISDDTDYEKDSFVVSSDEDDNDLLSGSGDDLSLSDKELSMSAKSKKKYNERQEKERKKASREMYEARHNINTSDKSSKSDKPKPKKLNRQRLDSTLLDSDNDSSIQPKKSKRLRIDSSQDVSNNIDVDESLSQNKKKSKRLSESSVNNSALNEKEITINNQSFEDKSDPLSVPLKQEPKTPQKEDSTAGEQDIDREEVAEIQVDENMSITKMNETSDPLQVTNIDDESSSSSDNNEIMQNYDSILNELNNDVKSKRAKLWDTSLNLNKKIKQKPNDLIVDQLNLTLNTSSKKIKTKHARDSNEKSEKYIIITTDNNADEENSSDSIDMRLLFPEDSNDSETTDKKSNNEISNKDPDDFIPLKRTEAKTDITDNENTSEINENEHSIIKKKDKRKSSICPSDDITSKKDEVNTILDTTGTELNLNESTASFKEKSKKKRNSISFVNDADDNKDKSEDIKNEDEQYNSKKNNTRKSSISNEESIPTNLQEKADVSFFVDTAGSGLNLNVSANVSLKNNSKKKKNKKISSTFLDAADADDSDVVEEKIIREEESVSKKRKRKTSADPSVEGDIHLLNTSQVLNNSMTVEKQNKKRKISRNQDQSPKQPSEETPECNVDLVPQENTQIVVSANDEVTVTKNKKRKRKDNHDDEKISKVFKENSLGSVHVPRLPDSILNQLDDKPKSEVLMKKKSQVIISTTPFVVEETKKKKNKPSNYLEESVYLDDLPEVRKQKSSLKYPKVLPFIPKASTSATGFTTNFRVNSIPIEIKFTAQSSGLPNFKNDFLQNRRVKKMGTYEMYKRRRNVKLSKF